MSESETEAGADATPPAVVDDSPEDPSPEPEVEERKATRTSGGGRGLALLALLVAVLAAVGTGFMWWQYRQFYVDLDTADKESLAAVGRVQDRVGDVTAQLETLERAEQAMDRRLDAMDSELEAIPLAIGELQSRLDAVRGVSGDARRRWLKAEAEYLLALANQELTLAGRWESAMQALTLADRKLRELANPAFTPVREEIDAALQNLRSVELPDTEGVSLSLANLAELAATLPLQGPAENAEVGPDVDPVDQAAPGVERAWASVKAAFTSLVRIDRRDEPVVRAFSAKEAALLRTSLKLELQAARFALLEGEVETYRDSLRAARSAIDASFDTSDGSVVGAANLIESLMDVSPVPTPPSISEPLNLLRRISAQSELEATP